MANHFSNGGNSNLSNGANSMQINANAGAGNSSNNATSSANSAGPAVIGGGRFDFDDGGTYCGGWHDGKAHGHGICTGPKGQGEYTGSWHYGFEVSGIYKWPSGATFEGQWQNGKRHGIGVEYRGKWVYKGEWTQGFKGRYGVRGSLLSAARYEGTWANGLQDGYGSETYADSGTYQGQWLRGMRHGYGVRTSAPFGHSAITKIASSNQNSQNPHLNAHPSLQSLDTEGEDQQADRDGVHGGFVLVARVSANQQAIARRRNSLVEKSNSSSSLAGGILKTLRLRKQRSTGDLDIRSQRNQKSMTPSLRSSREGSETGSTGSIGKGGHHHDAEAGSTASLLSQNGDISDPSTVETYYGEWKNDKRCGFGVCERTDGLRYEGEWVSNKKYGYGVTTFPDGTREEGKYKNNLLVTNIRKKHLFMMRSSKLRERIESAVQAASRAQQIALQKSDIAASRTATARAKSEQADYAASNAQNDSQMALIIAKQYGGASLTTGGGAHGGALSVPLGGQGSIAPLRRRLSDFSQVRRMREGLPPTHPFDPNNNAPNQQPSTPNRLDPNEPFGGRRGSFRNQMLTPDGYQVSAVNSPFYQSPPANSPNVNYTSGGGGGGGAFQPINSPHSARYMYSQHAAPGPGDPRAVGAKELLTEAFTDHFDHYALSKRGDTPTLGNSTQYLSNSRIPSSSQLYSPSQMSMASSSMSPSPIPSQPYPSSPSNFSIHQSASPTPSNQKPPQSGISMSNHSNYSRPPSGGSLIQSIPAMKPRHRMNMTNPNAIDYSVDESPANAHYTEPGIRHLRTASLYRPGTQQPSTSSGASGSGGGGGSGPLKRKPSLQTNVSKQINKPMMSREEASILSHQQREYRRMEQEYRERLSRNPLLYLWSPSLINWLNRQKLVILVFIINVCIAYLFIRMIV